MAKSERQKLKLLYICKILTEESDETHCISTNELIERLAREDIQAERKSIYSDIRSLQEFGMKIEQRKSRRGGGYYLKNRDFDTAELKLLVDAVAASRFITRDRSRKLIEKLEKKACVHDARQLKRQVFVQNRVKTQNESVFENADKIHQAIADNVNITFHYFEWTIDKTMSFRKDGEKYRVSPWALTVSGENYYLVSFEPESNRIKHFRVDKMADIELLKTKREGRDQFEQFDIGEYTNRQFGMFGGDEEPVTIQFPNTLVGVVLDRFGREIDIRKRDEDHFSVRPMVAVTNQFFGWLAGLGPEVRILMPERVRKEYHTYLREIIEQDD